MDLKPFVSVLMTCYNREKYIAQAIRSILSSTYTNFELIIVDDCSVDNTLAIARSFKEKDQRIKLYTNIKNLGDYPNRNKAAGYATGKYIKYVDSDDVIYPNGLEIMVNSMEAFPEAGFGMTSLEPNNTRPFPFMLIPKDAYQYHFFFRPLFHKGPLAAIIKKDVFDILGGFPPGRMISDTDMWHYIALKYPIVLIQDGIVWQRRHEEQELSSQDKFTFDREKIKWKYILLPQCALTTEQLKAIRKKCLKSYTLFILSGIKRLNFRMVILYAKCFWYVLKIKTSK